MFLQTKNLTSVLHCHIRKLIVSILDDVVKANYFLFADDSIVVVHFSDTEHTSVKEKLYQKYATRALMSGNLS